jgi:hypothetical protein
MCHQGIYLDGASNNIACNTDSNIALLFNMTIGTCNFCNNLTTGSVAIGGTGNVKVGNVFSFKSENITSSGINDIINVFNNITLLLLKIFKTFNLIVFCAV